MPQQRRLLVLIVILMGLSDPSAVQAGNQRHASGSRPARERAFVRTLVRGYLKVNTKRMNATTAGEVAASFIKQARIEDLLSPTSLRRILREVRRYTKRGKRLRLRGMAAALVKETTAKPHTRRLDKELRRWSLTTSPDTSHVKATRDFRDKIRPILAEHTIAWASEQGLTTSDVKSRAEGRKLASRVFHDERLQREIGAEIERLSGNASPELWSQKLWNAYFKAYDKVVAYSAQYNKLMVDAHKALPSGLIVDYGSGSGNFTALLQSGSRSRTILGLDISRQGLDLARQKVAALAKQDGPSKVLLAQADLAHPTPIRPGSVRGAVMNNVLYTHGSTEKKLAVLKQVYNDLAPGGVLVLSDPIPLMQRSQADVERLMCNLVDSAVHHKAPISAFDIAFVTEINRKLLVGSATPFSTPRQLSELARSAGFRVELAKPAYDGVDTFLVLRKPDR